jgi:hypothetical protein
VLEGKKDVIPEIEEFTRVTPNLILRRKTVLVYSVK